MHGHTKPPHIHGTEPKVSTAEAPEQIVKAVPGRQNPGAKIHGKWYCHRGASGPSNCSATNAEKRKFLAQLFCLRG